MQSSDNLLCNENQTGCNYGQIDWPPESTASRSVRKLRDKLPRDSACCAFFFSLAYC